MAEPLLHNPNNPITGGIWRKKRDGQTVVHKVLCRARESTHPDWEASDDPRSWLYWRRELDVYRSDLLDSLQGTGLRAPELRASSVDEDRADLWVEHVSGPSGADLSPPDLERASRALGRLQGAFVDELPEHPWISRGFLRDHCASKHVEPPLLHDEDAWSHPLIERCWSDDIRAAVTRLHLERELLFGVMDEVPRTWSHLDVWAHNLIARGDGSIAVVDWSCTGEGALGEDIGNLVAEAGLNDFVPAEDLPELAEHLFAAYCEGLGEVGAAEHVEAARAGFLASGVKFHWMAPLHLHRARTGEHHVYGGADETDPVHQYRQRGETLRFLGEQAARALD